MNKKYLFSFLIIASLFFGCKNDLIPEAKMELLAGYRGSTSREIDPPTNLTASQGLAGKIELHWTDASNASGYKIYETDNLASQWVACGQVKAEGCTYIYSNVKPGSTLYFCVSSINYRGEESEALSYYAIGSTLAKPVITDISQDSASEFSPVKVKWWMNNCNSSTYYDNSKYTVYVFEDESGTKEVKHVTIDNHETECEISGLNPRTVYFFRVAANANPVDPAETWSDIESAETAHRIIPNAVDSFEVSKGISPDAVRLEVKIPDFVDVKVSSGVYNQHPVYFEISRAEEGTDSYTKIATIKSLDSTDAKVNSKYSDEPLDTGIWYFDCGAEVSSVGLDLIPAGAEAEINSEYPAYVYGASFAWYDYTAERSKKYDYKIQTFTDDVAKTVSSDESCAYGTGWKLAQYYLTQKTVLTYVQTGTNEETGEPIYDPSLVEKVTVQLNLDFDTRDEKYIYTIESSSWDTDKSPTPENITTESKQVTLEDLNMQPIVFEGDALTDTGRYYSYVLKISDELGNELGQVHLAEKILVAKVDNVKIEYFDVEDGFADKFILKWDYKPEYTYSLSWEDKKEETFAEEDETELTLSESVLDLTSEDGYAIFIHTEVENGTNRKYILKASQGVTKEEIVDNKKTIGKPQVVFNEYSYDKIKVQWNGTQCADKYNVSAKFEGSDDEIASFDVVPSADQTSFEWTFEDAEEETDPNYGTKWIDYENAKISGKKIVVNVQAVNTEKSQDNKVDSPILAYTMGPALLETEVPEKSFASNTMSLRWNKIEGAKYYAIQRLNYSKVEKTVIGSADKYIYNIQDGTLSVNGEAVDSKRAQISVLGDKISLVDKYDEPSGDTDVYGVHQSEIPFGLPYGYIVIPMLGENDFDFDEKNVSGKVAYTNIEETINSTYGMGLNVHAEKACKEKMEVLTWDAPYVTGNEAYVYTRPAGSNSTWTLIGNTANKTINYEADKYDPYEYAVVYKNSSSTTMLPSYINYLARTLDSDTPIDPETQKPCEQLNKGYLLNIRYSAAYNGNKNDDGTYAKDDHYYAEKITWTPWDYTKKALGPDKMEFLTFNANLKKGWQTVASTDSTTEPDSLQCSESLEDTTVGRDGNGVELVPTSIKNGGTNTNGALKILRDAKHYYAVRLTRGTNVATIGSDYSTYAYRQITGEELIKATMLNVAAMIKASTIENRTDTGYSDGDWDNTLSGFVWHKKWAMSGNGNFKWRINNYLQHWTLPGGQTINSFIIMNDENSDAALRGSHAGNNGTCKLRCLSNGSKDYGTLIEIQVKPSSDYSDLKLDTYTGTVGFTCNDTKFKATASISNGETYSSGEKSGDDVKYWSPIRIGNVNTYFGGSDDNAVKYGWWPAE